jgi:hypothetical protein
MLAAFEMTFWKHYCSMQPEPVRVRRGLRPKAAEYEARLAVDRFCRRTFMDEAGGEPMG